MSDDVVYRTRIQNGDFNLCVWIFDNPDEAKECVEEFVDLKYDLEIGDWRQDSHTKNYVLDVGPDGFSAAVLTEEVHSTKDTALEGLREHMEATA